MSRAGWKLLWIWSALVAGCSPSSAGPAPGLVHDVGQQVDGWLGDIPDVVLSDVHRDTAVDTATDLPPDAAPDVPLVPDVPSQDLPPGPDVLPAFDITSTAVAVPVFPPDTCTDCGWSQMADMDGPRQNFQAAWSGEDLYIWGGEWATQCCQDLLATGARWNLKTNKWTALPQAPLYATLFSRLVWGGDRLYVYGADANGVPSTGPTPWSPAPAIAAMYFPSTNVWKPMPQSSTSPMHRDGSGAFVWTGSQFIVWGGQVEKDAPGGSYDPATDTWTPLPAAPIPESKGQFYSAAAWTGDRMFLWSDTLKAGVTWTPATATWTEVAPPPNAPATFFGWGATAMPGGVFLPQMIGPVLGWLWWEKNAVWQAVPRPDWFVESNNHVGAIWTGKYMLLWKGDGPVHGVLYDPVAGTWQTTPTSPEPFDVQGYGFATSGAEVFVLGGLNGPPGVNIVHPDCWRFKLPP